MSEIVSQVSADRIAEIQQKLGSFGTRNIYSPSDDPNHGIGAARDAPAPDHQPDEEVLVTGNYRSPFYLVYKTGADWAGRELDSVADRGRHPRPASPTMAAVRPR